MSAALTIVAGDTVSFSGVVIMPAGTWSAECVAALDDEAFELDVALTLAGPSEESGKFDWAIVLREENCCRAHPLHRRFANASRYDERAL
jgi:hypothetical protein